MDPLSLRVSEKAPEKCGKGEAVSQGGKVFIPSLHPVLKNILLILQTSFLSFNFYIKLN